MFLGFANFYQRFIQGFSWIAASKIQPFEGGVKVGSSRARPSGSKLDGKKIDDDEIDGDEVDDEFGTKVQKLSKSKNLF